MTGKQSFFLEYNGVSIHFQKEWGKSMNKTILKAVFAGILVSSLCACSASSTNEAAEENVSSSITETAGAAEETAETVEQEEASKEDLEEYQDVLDEYSKKITDATTSLIEEYNNEAAANQDGLEGLAELCNEKIEKLAEIETEGVTEMAELMYTAGSGSYEEYEEWAEKLYAVYEEQAALIQDAYMASAQ